MSDCGAASGADRLYDKRPEFYDNHIHPVTVEVSKPSVRHGKHILTYKVRVYIQIKIYKQDLIRAFKSSFEFYFRLIVFILHYFNTKVK